MSGRAQQQTLFTPAPGRTINTTTAIEDEVFGQFKEICPTVIQRCMHKFMNMNGENLVIIRITQLPHYHGNIVCYSVDENAGHGRWS